MDLKDRFSLGYLSPSTSNTSTSTERSFSREFEEAMTVYGRPILKRFETAENHKIAVHDLSRDVSSEIKINFDELMSVIKGLTDIGFIEIVQKDDVTGNHVLHLLPKGQAKLQI